MTSLPRRWLVAYVALLLIVLVGGGAFLVHEEELNRRQVVNQLESIAQLKIRQILQWRGERLGDGQVIVDASFAADLVAAWLADPTPERTARMQAWFASLQKNYQYTDVLLLDAQGRIRLSQSGNIEPLARETIAVLADAVRQKKALLTDLHQQEHRPPHQEVVSPLFTHQGEGQPLVGALVLRIDAQQFLYPMLQNWPVISTSAETLLVRRDGDDVLFLNELRHRRDTALRLRVPLHRVNLPAAMAASGRQGQLDGIDYRGTAVIAVGYPVPDSPWSMVAKIDRSEALAEWHVHVIFITLLMALSLLLLSAGLAVVWQRTRKKHYKIAYQAELERRLAEARYRAILLSVGDGVIVCDADGRVTLLNAVAEALTGWKQEEAVGRPVDEVFHIVNEESRRPVENPVTRVLREGIVVGLANHTSLITPAGAEYPIADSGAPIFDDQRRITGAVLVFRDQSEERLAEAQLRRTTHLLERAEEMADMGCWEFDFSTRKVWASPSARRIYGLNGAIWTIEEVQRIPLPEYRTSLNRALKALVMENVPYDIEFRIQRPSDGALVDIRSQAEYQVESATIFGIIQDVSARKRAEAVIRESESRYRSLFQNNYAVMVLLDPENGRVVDANPAAVRFYGWSREELLTKRADEIDTLPAEQLKAAMEQARREQCHVFALQHRLADGSIRDVEVIAGPILVEGRERLYAIVQDVSERRQAEEQRQRLQEQLLQAQKLELVGRLAGGVAHDLNNLLSPILGYSEMLQAELGGDAKQREYVGTIFEAAIRARDLVRQLLAFGRKQALVVATVDLNQVVQSFVPLLRRTVREDIHIGLALSPLAMPVRVDIGQIEQVLMNLVVNAQDAMPQGGRIDIETEAVVLDTEYSARHVDVQPGPHVRLTLSDTGCGMAEEVREQMFNPFFTTKSEGQGTGLGLATTYGIVKQHGGHIWVYSEIDQGTTFKIYLPWDESAAAARPQAAPSAEWHADNGPATATLMVVEDNAMVRELAVDILTRQGYTVLAAACGEECLQQMRSTAAHPIDLLLTDVVMPAMNGKALYKEAVTLQPGLRVLYMSGYTENVIASRGVLDEGVNFIQKPFAPKALVAKVRQVLRG